MKEGDRLDHIYLFAPPWGPIKHRPHHLMKAFAAGFGAKVLYIEDTGDRASIAWFPPWRLLRKVEPDLWAMKRFKIIPYQSKTRWSSAINKRAFAMTVRLFTKLLEMSNIVVWHWSPQSHEYVGAFGEGMTIYDNACETSLFTWAPASVREDEKSLLHKADLAFAATEPLMHMAALDNPHSYMIAQAVDMETFQRASIKASNRPPELTSVGAPILGFTGNIHEWIDGDLIRDVAVQRPSWQIVLIGPVRDVGDTLKEVAKFRDLSNVHMLGAKDYDVLPHYISWFDVCLIPYKLNDTTKVSETVKFYEYLATGKPIVSTALPPLRRWGDAVFLAANPQEFVECVEKALKEPPSSQERRRGLARKNTWDSRAKTAIELIREAWIKKYGTSSAEKSFPV